MNNNMDTQFKEERKATEKILLLEFMALPILILIIVESHIHIGSLLQNLIKFRNIFPVKTCTSIQSHKKPPA